MNLSAVRASSLRMQAVSDSGMTRAPLQPRPPLRCSRGPRGRAVHPALGAEPRVRTQRPGAGYRPPAAGEEAWGGGVVRFHLFRFVWSLLATFSETRQDRTLWSLANRALGEGETGELMLGRQ